MVYSSLQCLTKEEKVGGGTIEGVEKGKKEKKREKERRKAGKLEGRKELNYFSTCICVPQA